VSQTAPDYASAAAFVTAVVLAVQGLKWYFRSAGYRLKPDDGPAKGWDGYSFTGEHPGSWAESDS
jgi:hypothetical protein